MSQSSDCSQQGERKSCRRSFYKRFGFLRGKNNSRNGDTPAFLNYRPEGASTPFPATLCVSVNDEVVHGIPSKHRILKEGDIVSIDLGTKHKGLFTDMAMTVPVGNISPKNLKLLEVTKKSLQVGITQRWRDRVGDIALCHREICSLSRKWSKIWNCRSTS